MIDFATLLQMMVDQNSSDLFVTAGVAPSIKTHGAVKPACEEKFNAEQAREMCYGVMNERQRTQLENTFECQFAISARGIGRFRVSTFVQRGNVGMVVRKIETHIPTLEDLQVPMVLREIVHDQARSGADGGRHRHRQVHHAGGHGRLPQPQQHRPHHHHRGPGRVPARPRRLHRHPARGRRGHHVLRGRAQEHPAPGAGRDPDRRNPRPRDHGTRHRLRRDRPSVPGHAARQQRQPGAGPHHQFLPRGAAPAAADGPVAEPEGHRLAAPAADRRRQGPAGGGRGDAGQPADRRPDPQGRGARDQADHGALERTWHAHLRSGPARPVRRRPHQLRRRHRQRRFGQRSAPADQAGEGRFGRPDGAGFAEILTQGRAQGQSRRRWCSVGPLSMAPAGRGQNG